MQNLVNADRPLFREGVKLDLAPSVKRSRSRAQDENSATADKAFSAIRQSVLQRDNWACWYCGWVDKLYNEVHHLDDKHSNNQVSNLVAVCGDCEGVR